MKNFPSNYSDFFVFNGSSYTVPVGKIARINVRSCSRSLSLSNSSTTNFPNSLPQVIVQGPLTPSRLVPCVSVFYLFFTTIAQGDFGGEDRLVRHTFSPNSSFGGVYISKAYTRIRATRRDGLGRGTINLRCSGAPDTSFTNIISRNSTSTSPLYNDVNFKSSLLLNSFYAEGYQNAPISGNLQSRFAVTLITEPPKKDSGFLWVNAGESVVGIGTTTFDADVYLYDV